MNTEHEVTVNVTSKGADEAIEKLKEIKELLASVGTQIHELADAVDSLVEVDMN